MASMDDLVKQMGKTYGSQSVQVGVKLAECVRVDTGVFPFDLATGGGFPQGKISILYGAESSFKTTLSLMAIAHSQKQYPDKKCVFVDVEASYEPDWGAALGVDNDKLVYVLPDYAEQVVDMVEGFLHADDCGVVVIDSLAALITQNETESSAEKAVVGGAGLVVGKLYRKATLAMAQARKEERLPTLIAINQIRHKIGVMFGDPECVHADTLVNFVDGRSIPIREVVENKIDSPIWAFNEDTGEFFESRILSHHYNGQAKDGDFLTVFAQGVDTKNGVFSATVSQTHKFLTSTGWKTAKDLQVGDLLKTKYRSVISGTVKDFLAGALCGDTTLFKSNAGLSSGLKFQDSQNSEYAKWKAELLAPFFSVTGGGGSHTVSPTYDIGKFGEQFSGCRDPKGLFDNFSWLGFSVWIMDDGHYDSNHKRYTLSIGRFKDDPDRKKSISNCLQELGLYHRWNGKNVIFTVAASVVINSKCREYAPRCMAYKFSGGVGAGIQLSHEGVKYLSTYTPVTSISEASNRKYRDRGLYDLHIEGHHNYLVGNRDNGFVVHNTMPGGNAFKFASALTVRVYGKDEIIKAIDPVMPAYKVVSGIIKKAKQPISARNFEFKLSVNTKTGFPLGYCDDWNMLKGYLESLGVLGKDPKGKKWLLFGAEYPTLKAIKEDIQSTPALDSKCREYVVSKVVQNSSELPPDD